MEDLVRWLGEQFAEDERIARDAGGATWLEFSEGGWVYAAPAPMTEWKGPGDDGHHVASVRLVSERAHIAAHDPARVLREIDAKREIAEQHVPVGDGTVCLSYCHTRTPGEAQAWPCLTLRLLALPYSDRPGYRDEWKPVKLYRAGVPGVIDYEEAP